MKHFRRVVVVANLHLLVAILEALLKSRSYGGRNFGNCRHNVLSMLGSGTRATSRPYYNDSYAPLQRETVNS